MSVSTQTNVPAEGGSSRTSGDTTGDGRTGSSGPVPASGQGNASELAGNTRVFRPFQTIPPTKSVLSAVAAGTRESVTEIASLSEAASAAAGLAATFFGSGAETFEENPPTYAAKYPYNTVLCESESGHLIEVDDTPNAERVHVYHRSGSHIEMCPDGSVKYKTTKSRQDITIGNHDILVSGDWNIVVEGGHSIHVRNGEFVIEAKDGAAINVSGKLKLSADNIELKATNHIFLNAPKVDMGAIEPGGMPMMSLPGGVTLNEKWPFDPTFVAKVNVPLSPVGLGNLRQSLTPAGAATPVALSPAAKTKLAGLEEKIKTIMRAGGTAENKLASLGTELASAFKEISIALNGVPTFPTGAQVGRAIISALTKDAVDAAGEPAFSRLQEQPGIIPLSNPKLYTKSPELVRVRGRAFDSPQDVNNTDSYNAHINLSIELGDYTDEARSSPGILVQSDTTKPAPEPPPAIRMPLLSGGAVQLRRNSAVVRGVGTKFTEDLEEGQFVRIVPAASGEGGTGGGAGDSLTPQQAAEELKRWALATYNYTLSDAQINQIAAGVGWTQGNVSRQLLERAKQWAIDNVEALIGRPAFLTPTQAAQALRVWARETYNYVLRDEQIVMIMQGIGWSGGPISLALVEAAKRWAIEHQQELLTPPVAVVYTNQQAIAELQNWARITYSFELRDEHITLIAQNVGWTSEQVTRQQLDRAKQWMVEYATRIGLLSSR